MRLSPIPLFIVACAVLGAHAVRAQSADPSADPSAACEQAAQVAEHAYGLPPGLLGAIGRVESGRWDPTARRVRAWPWTLNAEGAGAYPSDHGSAVAAVVALQARGTRSIDIGCFQVNLLHHAGAFATLAEGFLPSVNADYAARFLLSLRNRTRSWPEAVAAYHSATPGLGDSYWAKVSSVWAGEIPLGREALRMPEAGSVPGVQVWTPRQPGTAPSWIRIGAAALPNVTYLASNNPSRN